MFLIRIFSSRITEQGQKDSVSRIRIRIKEFKCFNPKNCFCALGNVILDVHSGSGSWFFNHPGSRSRGGTGSRIRIRNTARMAKKFRQKRINKYILVWTYHWRAGAPSLRLEFLHRGLGINILQFSKKSPYKISLSVKNFSPFVKLKTSAHFWNWRKIPLLLIPIVDYFEEVVFF